MPGRGDDHHVVEETLQSGDHVNDERLTVEQEQRLGCAHPRAPASGQHDGRRPHINEGLHRLTALLSQATA